jgi:hypothetical protein
MQKKKQQVKKWRGYWGRDSWNVLCFYPYVKLPNDFYGKTMTLSEIKKKKPQRKKIKKNEKHRTEKKGINLK